MRKAIALATCVTASGILSAVLLHDITWTVCALGISYTMLKHPTEI